MTKSIQHFTSNTNMPNIKYYILAFKKYAVFTGRSQRAEYWFFLLFNVIFTIILTLIDIAINNVTARFDGNFGILSLLYLVIIFVPSIAVSIRRLHDTDHSGWWILVYLIPILGPVIFIFFALQDSDREKNQYGINPKGEKRFYEEISGIE